MSALPELRPTLPDWTGLVQDLTRPHGFEPLRIDGTVPDWLGGTLYRNGPATFGVGGTRYGHLFDGDGAITAVRLADGTAQGACRLVETAERKAELAAGRPRYGGFGTVSRWPLWDFLTKKIKNAANTSVLPYQGQLLALWEGGLPTALGLDDLRTLGTTDLGAIPSAFSAHPHRVPSRSAWYNFGIRMGRTMQIDLFELPDTGPVRKLTSTAIGAGMLHDFAVTEKTAIFLISPLVFRPLDYALGRSSYVESLDWRAEAGTEVVLIELDAPHRVRRFGVPAFYQWHFANAFDDGEQVVVDFIRYPDFATEGWLQELYGHRITSEANGRVVRARIDPKREQLDTTEIWSRSAEFPVIDGRLEGQRAQILWTNAHSSPLAAATTPLDTIARVDLDTGVVRETDLGPGTFPSEPIFVPRGPAEGDGALLSLTYDSGTDASFLAVLDATTLDVHARVWFDHAIPQTFHGRWLDAH